MTKFTEGTTDALLEEYYQLNEELLAKVEKLETERNLVWNKGYGHGKNEAHQTIVELQAKVEELEKQLKDALHLLFKSEDE